MKLHVVSEWFTLLKLSEERVTKKLCKTTSGGVEYIYWPPGRKGIQEIIWNYNWWGICNFYWRKGNKKNYDSTSGGGEVPLLTSPEKNVIKKLWYYIRWGMKYLYWVNKGSFQRNGNEEIKRNYIWWEGFAFIDPSGRNGIQKIQQGFEYILLRKGIQKIIWTTLTPLKEKGARKLYEPTSGGGEVPLLNPQEEMVSKKLY